MTDPQAQTAGSWLDNFVEYVKQAIDIIQLKTEAVDRARGDEEAFTMGLVIIALAGIASAIGSMNPFGVVFMPVLFIVFAFLFIAVFHLIATLLFGGEGEFVGLFRPLSLAYVLHWVSVVWILNILLMPLAGLWWCVVAVVSVEREYGLERPKAIATVAIPVVALTLLALMFLAFLGAAAILFGITAAR